MTMYDDTNVCLVATFFRCADFEIKMILNSIENTFSRIAHQDETVWVRRSASVIRSETRIICFRLSADETGSASCVASREHAKLLPSVRLLTHHSIKIQTFLNHIDTTWRVDSPFQTVSDASDHTLSNPK